MPLFETAEGKQLVQSWSIMRYLGRKYGYYTEDPETAWRIDSTLDAAEDYIQSYLRLYFETIEAKKVDFKEKWI